MKSFRKVCVVTGSRAEYGLLYWVLKEIDKAQDLQLQLVTTGMHLSPEFGLTYQQIEADGFSITRKVAMLMSSDSSSGIAKSMGLGMIGFADAFESFRSVTLLFCTKASFSSEMYFREELSDLLVRSTCASICCVGSVMGHSST